MWPGDYPSTMAEILGFVVAAFILVLAVGALTGRIRAQSCCGAGEARRDLRMRSAFDEGNDTRPVRS
jgi:hypothetical protein